MIRTHLLNVQIQWMMFQVEKEKIVFDDMIADIMTKKKFQAII